MHRIDGPGATSDNRFTDGDPVSGVQATVVTDDWANDIQEELMSILAAASVSPVKGTQNQVLRAITELVRRQSFTAYATGGSSPAFTLTPSPAISAYVANQKFRVKFGAASSNATLNISGLGAKDIKQYNSSGAKVAANVASGQLADVEYDGTDMVITNPLSATSQATESVLGVAKIASTSQVVSGSDDSTIVTPYKLSQGGSILGIAGNGSIKLPSWLARFSLQWMTATVSTTDTAFSFPTTFESMVGCWAGFFPTTSNALGTVEVVYVKSFTNASVTLQCSAGTRTVKVFAIGIIP